MTKENNSESRQQLGEIFFPKPPTPQPVIGPAVATSANKISVLDCRWRSDGPLGDVVECRVIMGEPRFAPGVPGQPAQGSIRFVANRQGAWYFPIAPFQQAGLAPASPRLMSRANVPHQQAFSLLWKPSTVGRPQGLEFEIHAERLEYQKVTHFAAWTGPERPFVRLVSTPGGTVLLMRPDNG